MNNGGFVKGLIIGGIVGASVSMMMNDHSRGKKRMMWNGNNFLRKSGRVVNDVIDLFR